MICGYHGFDACRRMLRLPRARQPARRSGRAWGDKKNAPGASASAADRRSKMKIGRILCASALALMAPLAAAQNQLSIATGGTGGVYYPLGGGIAELINKHMDGYKAVAEVTGASVENMGLIAGGDSDVAFALADTVYQAYHGTGRFDGKKLPVRAIAAVYPNAVQIVTLGGSDIKSLQDLKGKRVSVGAPGSGTEVNAKALL